MDYRLDHTLTAGELVGPMVFACPGMATLVGKNNSGPGTDK